MKRLILILLCLALCLSLSVTAFAEEAEISVLDSDELEGMMADFIAEHNIAGGNISIGFIYTGTGERWFYNENEWYYAGSMYKVPMMMLMAEKEKAGELNAQSDINGITLEKAKELILVYSNNEWAHVIRNYLGGDAVWREETKKYSSIPNEDYDPDFVDYGYVNPVFVVDVMEELFDNSESYPGIQDMLLQAEPENYFRFHLEGQYDIAQKYGALKEFYHTCGIIYTPTPIILTVMTENLSGHNKLIGDAAKMFADYALKLDERYEEKKAEAEKETEPTPEPEKTPEPAAAPQPTVSIEPPVSAAAESRESRTADTMAKIAAVMAAIAALLAFVLVIINIFESIGRSISRRRAAKKTAPARRKR